MNLTAASSGVSQRNIILSIRRKRRGIRPGDEAVLKVQCLCHFDQREKSILLSISNTDFSLTLEMTLSGPFETASSIYYPLFFREFLERSIII